MAILEDHSAKWIFAMLTLSRREFESLTFFTSDGEIQINIEDIKGGQVRLSLDILIALIFTTHLKILHNFKFIKNHICNIFHSLKS